MDTISTKQEDHKTALVLGATGGIGGETARRLQAAGWRVRALHRDPGRIASSAPGFEWIAGDAMNAADVLAAARGARLIVHAVNPPGYRRWSELVLPMMDNTLAAARETGARIVLPGTVYNFGPDAFPVLREDSPQHPTTRKGAIRVEMESRLERAAQDGVRSLVVRAGDFFGPRAANNWFSAMVKPGAPVTVVRHPGTAGVGHAWAYLPDVAETIVRLVERDDGATRFERFHMDGHWDATGQEMAEAIRRVVAAETGRVPRIARFPWMLALLASPFVTLLRELREMRYLWRLPVRMDNAKLVRALGREPHTPLEAAVRATLAGQGNLGIAAATGAGKVGVSPSA